MTDDTAGQDIVNDTVKEGALESAWDVVSGGAEAVGGWALDEVTAVGETAYHAGSGVVNMAEGNWDDAAKDMTEMSSSALNFVTGGLLGAAETGYNVGTEAAGGGPSAHDQENSALKSAGEWLGDEAYSLTHPDESN
jgi:hypothetical protein